MQVKNIGLRLAGASLIAVGIVPLLGGTAFATDTPTATDSECVAPDQSVFTFERLESTTYRVSLKVEGTITCTPVTFNVGSWTVPDTWDRKGFNETALPQVEFDYAALTFPAGGTDPVTATVKVPSCGPYQTDLYAGVRRPSPLVFPNPLGQDRIIGTIIDQPTCETSTPTETVNTPTTSAAVVPPTASTPEVSTSVLGTKVAKTPAEASSSPEATTEVQAETLPKTGGGLDLRLLVVSLALLLGGGSLVRFASQAGAKVPGRRH